MNCSFLQLPSWQWRSRRHFFTCFYNHKKKKKALSHSGLKVDRLIQTHLHLPPGALSEIRTRRALLPASDKNFGSLCCIVGTDGAKFVTTSIEDIRCDKVCQKRSLHSHDTLRSEVGSSNCEGNFELVPRKFMYKKRTQALMRVMSKKIKKNKKPNLIH